MRTFVGTEVTDLEAVLAEPLCTALKAVRLAAWLDSSTAERRPVLSFPLRPNLSVRVLRECCLEA